MPIRILPSTLAALIAAGEVVERPFSVVKELVENSIDAGASQITVEILAGGVDLIRVVDDGAGIPPEEVPLAFQRHATSKLASPEDLDSVATMGFRGEAMPSIAAVSLVTIQTRLHHETAGFRMHLRWGEPVESGPEGCSPGTSVEVSQLFGNQPARRKFLRSAQAETARVQELVSRYSLAFPEIRFRLVNDGRASLSTPGNGQPREALLAVYGSQVAESMLEVHADDPANGYAVEGFVCRSQRKSRQPHLHDLLCKPKVDPEQDAVLRGGRSVHRSAADETVSCGRHQHSDALFRGGRQFASSQA